MKAREVPSVTGLWYYSKWSLKGIYHKHCRDTPYVNNKSQFFDFISMGQTEDFMNPFLFHLIEQTMEYPDYQGPSYRGRTKTRKNFPFELGWPERSQDISVNMETKVVTGFHSCLRVVTEADGEIVTVHCMPEYVKPALPSLVWQPLPHVDAGTCSDLESSDDDSGNETV